MLDSLRGYPRAFWVLFAGTFVNRLGLVVLPFLTLYLTGTRGFSIEQATLVVSLYGAGAFVAGPLGGALCDRLGRKPVLIGSLAGGAALMVAIPQVEAYGPLAALVFAFGVVGEMYRPAVSAAVSDLVPPERFARAFALVYWAINLGVAIGPALGGLLAERVGYAVLFSVDAATMVVYAIAVAVGVPETRPDPGAAPLADPSPPETAPPEASGAASSGRRRWGRQRRGGEKRVGALRRALRDPGLVGLSLATFGVGVGFVQCFSTTPLVMEADGLGPGAYGVAVMVNGAVVVALSLPVARWAESRLSPALLAAAVLLIGVGVSLHGVADSLAGHVLAVAVWSLGEIAFIPLVPALIARLAPEALRGTYQGVNHAGWGLAKVVGPAVGGLALAQVGEAALWGGAFGLSVVTALVLLWLRPGAGPRPLAEAA